METGIDFIFLGSNITGPSWERSRPRASSSRRRSLMVAAGGRRPGEGGSGEARLEAPEAAGSPPFIGLEDCTTTHTEVKGGVQRPGGDSNK